MSDYRVDQLQIRQEQESRALQKIPEIEKQINLQPIAFLKKSFDFVKLRDRRTEPEFGMLIGLSMAKLSALAGISTEIDNLNKEDLRRMIFTFHSDLSIEDIYKAFELERFGVYETKTEHYNLFNADYVSQILKKYKAWRITMKQTHSISKPREENEMTPEEKQVIVDNGIIRKYNEFVETNKIEEPFVYIFDDLIERNIIKGSGKKTPELDRYYQNKLDQANREITEELKEFVSTDKSERNSAREELKKILEGESSNKVQVRAKRIVLTEFFTKLKLSGTPIENIFKK